MRKIFQRKTVITFSWHIVAVNDGCKWTLVMRSNGRVVSGKYATFEPSIKLLSVQTILVDGSERILWWHCVFISYLIWMENTCTKEIYVQNSINQTSLLFSFLCQLPSHYLKSHKKVTMTCITDFPKYFIANNR